MQNVKWLIRVGEAVALRNWLTLKFLAGLFMLISLLVIMAAAPPDGEEKMPPPSNFDVKPTLTYDAFVKLADTVNHELSPEVTLLWMTQMSDGSPLNWPEIVCIDNETEILEAWKNSNNGMPPPASDTDPICLDMGEPVFDLYQLTGDIVLRPVETGKAVAIVLKPVGIPVPFSAKVVGGSLPGNLLFDQDSRLLAIYTPLLTRLSSPSYTDTFTVEIKSNGVTHYFDITVPIKLAIDADHSHTFRIGQSVNTQFDYSGGPLTCNSVPTLSSGGPAVPCGPLNWSYAQTEGGPLPAGLTLNSRIGNLSGTTSPQAYSSRGKLHLGQAGETAQRSVEFLVPVWLSQGDIDAIAGVHEITRDTSFDYALPRPYGGDGSNYTWSIEYTSSDGSYLPPLPSGLNRVLDGDHWRIQGTVAPDAPIEARTVQLRVASTMGQAITNIPMEFRLTVPFDVWTQNTILRPPSIISVGEIAAMALVPFVGPRAAALATEIKIIYDNSVENTDADNRQRANMLLQRASRYDVVALQEVFEEDNQQQVVDMMSDNYHVMWGPPAASELPIVDVPLHSGLALLIKKSLTSNPSNNPAPYHRSDDYDKTGGLLTTDSWANKGFTLDKVHFGPNTNDYVWVVNTHTKAETGTDNTQIRQSQLTELGSFVATNTDSQHPVIFMGDFNVIEESPEYGDMLQFLGLPASGSDLFQETHPLGSSEPRYSIDTNRNAYTLNWGNQGVGHLERLDYILVRQGSDYRIEVDRIELTDDPVQTGLCGSEEWLMSPLPSPTLGCYLSDHFGLSAELRLVKR